MENLSHPLKQAVTTLLQRHNIIYAGLFGSRAKGLGNSKSDYDILIEFAPEKKYSLFDLMDVQEELESVLSNSVDVVTTRALNKHIKQEVLSTVTPIYDHR